jgi:hypothetical protein
MLPHVLPAPDRSSCDIYLALTHKLFALYCWSSQLLVAHLVVSIWPCDISLIHYPQILMSYTLPTNRFALYCMSMYVEIF